MKQKAIDLNSSYSFINKNKMVKNSEMHAVAYILKELKEKKGWGKNKIYTQHECQNNSEIKKLLEKKTPENIIQVNEKTFYVIEAKNERKKIDQALKEAREDYANKINKSEKIKSLFITGVAGNDRDGYISKSQYYKNGKWEIITENKVEITGLLSTSQVETILKNNNSNIEEVEISEEEFLKTAKKINEILHKNSIEKSYRARFISALLLAMSEGKDIDVTETNSSILISGINKKVEVILGNHKKGDFSRFIKIDEPSNEDNHTKVRNAIVQTYQELLGLNIRSAMKSGKDILGKFYEVFLKYGNGAKEIGIVLTPRHITKFVSEVLDIGIDDLILDPCCGTGGFLISAYDEVRKKTKNEKIFEVFKKTGLYGIEEQDPVIALAIVNMIFRGDGKNNMVEGDCFKKWLNTDKQFGVLTAEYLTKNENGEYINQEEDIVKERIPPITKVMMNPPFASKNATNKEYRFIEQALKQMRDKNLLFSVLPISVLIENETKKWRKEILLKNNRLVAVITFPEDLFYPVSVGTIGIFIQKGVPHNFEKDNVYFARCIQDGFVKKKGVRKESERARNMLNEIKDELKQFIKDQSLKVKNIPEFKKVCKLDKEDDDCELVAEAYLDSSIPSFEELKEGLDNMIREATAFKIKYHNLLEK